MIRICLKNQTMTVKEMKRRAKLTTYERIKEDLLLLKLNIIARFDVNKFLFFIQLTYLFFVFGCMAYNSIFFNVYYADTAPRPIHGLHYSRTYDGTPITFELRQFLEKEYLAPYMKIPKAEYHALFEAQRQGFDSYIDSHVVFSTLPTETKLHIRNVMLIMSYSKEYMINPIYHNVGHKGLVVPWVEFYRLFKTDFFEFVDKMTDLEDFLASFTIIRWHLLCAIELSVGCNCGNTKMEYGFHLEPGKQTENAIRALDSMFRSLAGGPRITPLTVIDLMREYLIRRIPAEEVEAHVFQAVKAFEYCHSQEWSRYLQMKHMMEMKAKSSVASAK